VKQLERGIVDGHPVSAVRNPWVWQREVVDPHPLERLLKMLVDVLLAIVTEQFLADTLLNWLPALWAFSGDLLHLMFGVVQITPKELRNDV